MTEEEVLNILKELQDSFRKEKRDATTEAYSIYYEGHVNALRVAIKRIKEGFKKE